ncbi:GerW family sporulation protein [Paramaledivibacter caminithermalis]|jgi:sporulation protein YtfJ|uniref:Sporulation protein YtfJ n=1 Tax=Paramaledivibacter caminithermalis (strain DSM 15212 / CIP 107654 / DViRD3) TaxID=1121301 RepID=A0A1M6JP00_PARC5|nr:GerW family sporulation protein [Paramaledivibacter caminithermalis]SHJ48293.1 sporulation protein YtfJ [Paramaledivibacter caminithermalis DSM 15212]
MNSHPIEALMKTTMESLKQMIDVNTIVGDAVETPDGTTIIPISRVSFGFASGGGEYKNSYDEEESSYEDKQTLPFAGGTGAGVSVQPVAFMIVGKGNMKLLSVDQSANMFENLVGLSSKLIDKIQGGDSKNKNDSKDNKDGNDNGNNQE